MDNRQNFDRALAQKITQNGREMLQRLIRNLPMNAIWGVLTENEKVGLAQSMIGMDLYIIQFSNSEENVVVKTVSTPDDVAALKFYLDVSGVMDVPEGADTIEFFIAPITGGNARDGWLYDGDSITPYFDAEPFEEPEVEGGMPPK